MCGPWLPGVRSVKLCCMQYWTDHARRTFVLPHAVPPCRQRPAQEQERMQFVIPLDMETWELWKQVGEGRWGWWAGLELGRSRHWGM